MRERPVPRLSRLPSMGSQQRLPWPSVCGSLELTARSRRSSSSAWILPSRGSVCPFSHPCFRWSTLLTDKIDILFSFPFFHPLLPSSRQQVKETCFSFFCLLASISLRIPWEAGEIPRSGHRGRSRASARVQDEQRRPLRAGFSILLALRQPAAGFPG